MRIQLGFKVREDSVILGHPVVSFKILVSFTPNLDYEDRGQEPVPHRLLFLF